MPAKLKPRVLLDRILQSELHEFVQCGLCHGLLWNPIGCAHCDNAVCLPCVQKLGTNQSEIPTCPDDSAPYTKQPCSQVRMRLLNSLQITCRNKSNGCSEILPYGELEGHEAMCDYQLLLCMGCQRGIVRKDFSDHKSECPLRLVKCDQCLSLCKREDTELHTITDCLCVQVQQQKLISERLATRQSAQQQQINEMKKTVREYQNIRKAFSESIDQIQNMFNQNDN